jgi:hypothetical protein
MSLSTGAGFQKTIHFFCLVFLHLRKADKMILLAIFGSITALIRKKMTETHTAIISGCTKIIRQQICRVYQSAS